MIFGETRPIPRSERGAAMLAALCLAMVFAISLTSYIALCYVSLNMSTRSIALAHTSELAEAGVEQALYELNNSPSPWTNWSLSGSTATTTLTMTSSGLVPSSSSPTPLNYGNGMVGTVALTVANYNTTNPSITSHAIFTLPAYAGSTSGNTTSSTVTFSVPSNPATGNVPIFVNAVAAITSTVRFRSAGTVDSYNSNPSPGVYQTYAMAVAAGKAPGYSAVILSQDNTTTTASVRLGNAVVRGYAVGYNYYYPSTTNWLSYSAAAKVVGPLTSASTYIDSSRLMTCPVPYQPLITENLPNGSGNLPGGSSGGNVLNMGYTFPNTLNPVVYYANGINLSSGTVVIKSPVVLIVYGPISISGSGGIQLTTSQASLQIFAENSTVAIGGNGITNTNAIPLPKKVAILSTSNNYSWNSPVTFSTNTPFYGVIYFPYLTVSVTSTAPQIYGSIVGSAVSFTNSPTIHYDLALRSPMPPYTHLIPLQSGAAFDNLSSPLTFSGMVVSVP